MPEQLPVFPLNMVMYPGVSLSLHVFEERYRDLVHHLLQHPGHGPCGCSASWRSAEGYEVGQHRAAQSLHRVGCVVQLTSVEPYEDGRFDIEVVGRQRMRLDGIDTSGSYLVGEVEPLDGAHQQGLGPRPGGLPHPGHVRASTDVGWPRCAAARCSTVTCPATRSTSPTAWPPPALLTLQERQDMLEAETSLERLVMVRRALVEEMRAMRAIPSLPATEVARTSWSPN